MATEKRKSHIDIGTYTQVTGDRLLNTMGVRLSKKELDAQLKLPNSPYRQLLNLASTFLATQLDLYKYDDMAHENEYRLMNINFHDHLNLLNLNPEQKQELDALVKESADNIQELNTRKQRTQTASGTLNEFIHTQIDDWRALQEENANNIIAGLQEQGYELSPRFKDNLQHQLELQGAGVDIDSETLKEFNVTGEPTPVQKAVIAALLEE